VGDGRVTEPSPFGGEVEKDLAPLSYTHCFEEQLPFYMAIGMTWSEFWDDDCEKARFYRKAHKLRQNMENQKLWMLGAYVYEALCDVSPVLNAFAKAGTKPNPYRTEPFPLTKQEVEHKQEERKERLVVNGRDKMFAWMAKTNETRKKLEQEVMKNGRDDGQDCH